MSGPIRANAGRMPERCLRVRLDGDQEIAYLRSRLSWFGRSASRRRFVPAKLADRVSVGSNPLQILQERCLDGHFVGPQPGYSRIPYSLILY